MSNDSNIVVLPLIALLKERSKNQVTKLLKTFKSKNTDVQSFLHQNAISFEQKGRARTYIMLNISTDPVTIEAYISVTLKSIILDPHSDMDEELTENIRAKTGIAQNESSFVTLLVAQFGKNQDEKISLNGDPKNLLSYAWEISRRITELAGGLRTLFVECEAENERLVSYYEELGFQKFNVKQRDGHGSLTQFFALIDDQMSFMESEDE